MIVRTGAEAVASANNIALPARDESFWSGDRIDRLRALRNEGKSFRQIGAALGTSRSAIASRLRRMRDDPLLTYQPKAMNITVPTGRKPRPAPPGFETVIGRMTERGAARFYRVSHGMISRWKKELAVQTAPRGIPAPQGFASYAPTATLYTLASHFGVDRRVVQRWCREAGVEAKRPVYCVPRGNRIPPAPRVHRDLSPAGDAVEFLRQYGPIYRCRETGRADAKGQFWSRGGFVLTDDDIITRARRLGWDPQAWRRVA